MIRPQACHCPLPKKTLLQKDSRLEQKLQPLLASTPAPAMERALFVWHPFFFLQEQPKFLLANLWCPQKINW
jgi:hypothetical protein